MRISRSGAAYLVTITILYALAIAAGRVEISQLAVAIVIVCFACELIDSSLGMGYGTALTPLLLLFGFDPLQLVPTILISELVTGLAASFFHSEAGNVRFHRGSPHLRIAIMLSAVSVVGVAIGVNLAFAISRTTLTRVIGLILLAAGIFMIVTRTHPVVYRRWKLLLLTLTASFNKSISGGGYGPLMTSGQVLSGVEPKAAVGITSLAEAATCLVAAALFLLRGGGIDEELLLPVVFGAMASVPFSATIVSRVREAWFRMAIALFAIAMALVILLRSAM